MSNSIHSSFSKVYVYPYTTDGVMPTTFAYAGGTKLDGLISGSVTGPTNTQIKDTEQESVGGAEEFYPGRLQPITAAMKFSYSIDKLKKLWGFLPKPLGERTQPDYGRFLFDFTRIDGLKIRSFGYLQLGAIGDGEDDRQTIDATVQGSGLPILVTNETTGTPATHFELVGKPLDTTLATVP